MGANITDIQNIYLKFLAAFPPKLQPYVSLLLGVLIVISIFQVLKKNFIWLIVLVVLLPASLGILKGAFTALLSALKFLFGVRGT